MNGILPPPLPPITGHGWTARIDAGGAVIILVGDWIAREDGVESGTAERILSLGGSGLSFDCARLGHWDSALIAFLLALRDAAQFKGVPLDESELPPAAQQLLRLAQTAAPASARPAATSLLTRVGRATVVGLYESGQINALIGATLQRSWASIFRRSALRGGDLVDCMMDAGLAALPIVTLVNLLVGGIIAFVGAVQLRRFGADIYVAGLVDITMVREMAAMMTAIIMAGRTGGAYAATVATMEGNDEIDALRVFGIPVFDYLILPRILALTLMMPILYLYGCAVGIMGGLLVTTAILAVSPISFMQETRLALTSSQFLLGLAKSLSFGALIALVSCRVGLRAGRSAADVGRAATSAVVVSVVGIIALDAAFDVGANVAGI